jgi:hypothetical protein
MTVVRSSNTYAFLTTVLVLVLSMLACAVPSPTTGATTPVPTVVKVLTTPQKPPTTPVTTAKVTAYRSLRVRQHPTTAAAVLAYLYNSETVTLTGKCRDGWAQIAWKGSVAWVRAKYLSDNACKE